MPNRDHLKGRRGVYLVLHELLKRKIDGIPTPLFWPFDIFTSHGIIIEVKLSNIGKSKGGTGSVFERFTCLISPIERSIMDFLVFVLNTKKGYFFYVIPEKAITCNTIAFNPFSQQESQYEKYLNRWDLIQDLHNLRLQREKFKEYSEKLRQKHSYFTRLNKIKGQNNLDKKSVNK